MSGVDPGSLVLALETSGPLGTVAVGTAAGRVLGEVCLEERRQHASRLVPAVGEALAEAGVERSALGGVVVGSGPGSFTGVRVAAATAKGLCHALEIPLRAVSSLAVAALDAAESGAEGDEAGEEAVRYVLFDARGDRVYAACYEVGAGGVEERIPPHAGTVGEVVAGPVPREAVFVGSGAARHRRWLEEEGHAVGGDGEGRPSARALLAWVALHPDHPPVDDPGRWEPTYLRASNAEREWRG